MNRDCMLEARNIQHTLSNGTESLSILRGAELRLDAGESLAILGPSGSGKSTLLSILAGFERPTSGHVKLAGEDLSAADEEQRAKLRATNLGFVFQSFALLPQATALDNVRIAADIAGTAKPVDAARHWLQQMGLGERLNHRPAELSGGEQQRVALARAFVNQPALILADEPTGNLDQGTGARIMQLMFDHSAQHNTALLLVTHDDSLAARCQRRLHLSEGQLVEAD